MTLHLRSPRPTRSVRTVAYGRMTRHSGQSFNVGHNRGGKDAALDSIQNDRIEGARISNKLGSVKTGLLIGARFPSERGLQTGVLGSSREQGKLFSWEIAFAVPSFQRKGELVTPNCKSPVKSLVILCCIGNRSRLSCNRCICETTGGVPEGCSAFLWSRMDRHLDEHQQCPCNERRQCPFDKRQRGEIVPPVEKGFSLRKISRCAQNDRRASRIAATRILVKGCLCCIEGCNRIPVKYPTVRIGNDTATRPTNP